MQREQGATVVVDSRLSQNVLSKETGGWWSKESRGWRQMRATFTERQPTRCTAAVGVAIALFGAPAQLLLVIIGQRRHERQAPVL